MERRAGPGSPGGGAEDGDRRRRFDHLARYAAPGAYIVDEETGEYSEYEIPEDQGTEVEWSDILDQPGLIAADFAAEYGIRLHQVGNTLTWREFHTLVGGLLACDSRLSRYLLRATKDESMDEEGGDPE